MTQSYFQASDWLEETEIEHTELVIDLINKRRELNISQKELAEKANIDQGQLSRIERLESTPTLKTISKLARALDSKLQLS
ncbi:hypothetical protein WN59_09830 [Salinicoccus sediminis]|uniref:HTH cro/C1-type domain-containing protein n=1 Tax=Salinicoccus sediminis TaxID=1432562 RepID=A0A0M2SMS6_9STAP|nr:helix-turn-helix transcriptional regulator [Salinicoccus sediminis]KKK33900.1 hypothetical protein WN59_09830 [Salinicoccus sediminis]